MQINQRLPVPRMVQQEGIAQWSLRPEVAFLNSGVDQSTRGTLGYLFKKSEL